MARQCNGARWWKCDLHAHSPASDDYGKGSSYKELHQLTPKDWLLSYMRAGVDCVAITDHNTGKWVNTLQHALQELREEMPEGYRELYLFPGVELTVNGGLHVLAIFDTDKTTTAISQLLAKVEYPGTEGKSDAETLKSFHDVVTIIDAVGGIALPAHADAENGVLNTLQGNSLKQALESLELPALEVIDENVRSSLPNGNYWALLSGSDAHHPLGYKADKGPGARFTWVKMSHPTLEGLRLALMDGELSVIHHSRGAFIDPNAHGKFFIKSVAIDQAKYMGRSETFRLQLNPWLNAIIGGRGTGKSSLLEFIRIALDRTDELPRALQPEMAKYWQVSRDRREEGLLTANTSISIELEKDGTDYRLRWTPSDGGTIEVNENGEWLRTTGAIRERFPVRIYSQKQIYELASDSHALLQIIDASPEVGRSEWEAQWRSIRDQLYTEEARLRQLEGQLSDEARIAGELDDVLRKLEVIRSVYGGVIGTYEGFLERQEFIEHWEGGWRGWADELGNLVARWRLEEILPGLFDEGDVVQSNVLALMEATVSKLTAIVGKLHGVVGELRRVEAEWEEGLAGSGWRAQVEAAAGRHDAALGELRAAGVEDPEEYDSLLEKRRALERRVDVLATVRAEAEEVRRAIGQLRARLVGVRQDLTARRSRFLASVLAGNEYVRIRVKPYGAKDLAREELRNLLGVETAFERDIEDLLERMYRENGENAEDRIEKMKEHIRSIANGEAGEEGVRDARFARHLRRLAPAQLDKIDAWFPEDDLEVEYRAGRGEFRAIAGASPGQKTTALLSFLLAYGREPLIVDQPEDDLDNRLIYELVVSQLRRVKEYRQVLMVTHNPNLVVNGDAELVLAFSAGGGQTWLDSCGSLQEGSVRDAVCRIMEGGEEALRRRYAKIVLARRR